MATKSKKTAVKSNVKSTKVLPKGQPTASSDLSATVGAVPSYDEIDELSEIGFDSLVVLQREISLQISELEAKKKELQGDIEAALIAVDITKVTVENLIVERCVGRTASKLSKEKLLELGVDADVIAAAVEPGREYTYVQVKEAKAKGGVAWEG